MLSGPAVVDAAGTRGEGHAPYPGRSVRLPCATFVERLGHERTEVSRGREAAVYCGERAEHVR